MNIKLGYVAISLSLNTASKTTTFKNYSKLNEINKFLKIDSIIKQNFLNLEKILLYNFKNGIHFYRLSPNIIPLATHPNVDINYINIYKDNFKKIGNMIKLYNIRVDIHPNHYCILNSPNKEVIQTSKKILKYNYNIFKAMGIDGKIILHVGGLYKDKDKSIKRFISNFKKIDKEIRNMIILENDDKVYNIKDTLLICESLNIPMVLDYHHFKCNNCGEDITEYIERILNTWKEQKLNPKMHFSSPKSKKEFRNHNDYINSDDFIKFIKMLTNYNTDIDIMLECKRKDEALFKLIRELKYKTNYKFINETTIKAE